MLLRLSSSPPPPPLLLRRNRRSFATFTPPPLKPPKLVPPFCTPPKKTLSVADDELGRLIVLLPPELRRHVESHPEFPQLIEIVIDLGRRPIARFPSGDFFLSDQPIAAADIHHAASQVGEFTADNRAGISRTLHRISAIRNRKGLIVGLTCRVGRAVTGSANLVKDLVEDGGSLLVIGPPGVGKTTIIREIARMLADDFKQRVMIVDTSNEIGGDGDIPHAGIGSARRLQVPNPDMQHKVLIEAVENHMPQVIVIDEIGTRLEALAASTIAQRGIQLVATAHGVTIENLIMNPSLEMLVGGIQSVTLGDEEANRRRVQKTVLERKGPSVFTCGAEIISKTEIRVHRSLEATVDAILAGWSPRFEIRKVDSTGDESQHSQIRSSYTVVSCEDDEVKGGDSNPYRDDKSFKNDYPEMKEELEEGSNESRREFQLFLYGITEASVLQAVRQLGIHEVLGLTDNIVEADAVLAQQSKLKKNPHIQAVARSHEIPIFVTKTSSLMQITRALRVLLDDNNNEPKFRLPEEHVVSSEMADALEEARLAIEQVVIPRGEFVQLLPRPSDIISAQIDLIKNYKLKWEMVGQEPNVTLKILPLQASTRRKKSADRVDVTPEVQDLNSYEEIQGSQNGIARLPLLPD